MYKSIHVVLIQDDNGIVHPKMKIVIYSLSSCSKPVWVYEFKGTVLFEIHFWYVL